jgi:hypothetical protein
MILVPFSPYVPNDDYKNVRQRGQKVELLVIVREKQSPQWTTSEELGSCGRQFRIDVPSTYRSETSLGGLLIPKLTDNDPS